MALIIYACHENSHQNISKQISLTSRNENLLRSFGKNLDILTDLIWTFNNCNSFLREIQNTLPFFVHMVEQWP